MARKENIVYSILGSKCPRCHQGRMFPAGTLYSFSRFAKMNASCSHCGQSFDPEPGFYFGAMLVSYAISTAIFVAVWVTLALLLEEVTLTMMIVAIVAIVVGLLPVNFRLSRSIWIHMMVKYKGPVTQQDH